MLIAGYLVFSSPNSFHCVQPNRLLETTAAMGYSRPATTNCWVQTLISPVHGLFGRFVECLYLMGWVKHLEMCVGPKLARGGVVKVSLDCQLD